MTQSHCREDNQAGWFSLPGTHHGYDRPRVHVLHQPIIEWPVLEVDVVFPQKVLRGLG